MSSIIRHREEYILISFMGLSLFHSLIISLFHSFFYDVPVNNLPKRGEMIGPTILVIEVVGMFPDVEGQQGLEAFLNGIGGVHLLRDDEFAVLIC